MRYHSDPQQCIPLKQAFSSLLQELQVSGKESLFFFLVEGDLAVTFTETCNVCRAFVVLTMLPKMRWLGPELCSQNCILYQQNKRIYVQKLWLDKSQNNFYSKRVKNNMRKIQQNRWQLQESKKSNSPLAEMLWMLGHTKKYCSNSHFHWWNWIQKMDTMKQWTVSLLYGM